MTPDELRAVHDALHRLRNALVEAGDHEVAAEWDTNVASNRDQDQSPLVEMGQTIASSRNRARAEQLLRIDVALRRLANDPEAFGLCTSCGEPIPARRLALLPFAIQCVPCQNGAEDAGKSRNRRKVTDYV
ncbi:MAG: TraR/DksA family transcriptional regulator [Myxococcales bacterium]|nr:TraR/DksA family transcriptional regulator [Myxococcales bacterium]